MKDRCSISLSQNKHMNTKAHFRVNDTKLKKGGGTQNNVHLRDSSGSHKILISSEISEI